MKLRKKQPQPEGISGYDYSDRAARERTAYALFRRAKNARTAVEIEWENTDVTRDLTEFCRENDIPWLPASIPDPYILVESQIEPTVPQPEFRGRDDDLDSAMAKRREFAVRYIAENNRLSDMNTRNERRLLKLGDAFWKNEENSVKIIQRLNGHKHLIRGNHDRVHSRLRFHWESIEQYAEINDGNTLVIMSHYPIMFYKNQHYGSVMLYGHVHNTREWQLVEKWKHEQWDMGIPSRLINVGCMMDYMRYTPRTLEELLDANPMPIFDRILQDGTPVDSPSEDSCNG